jgi:hypothetical protein
MPSAKYFFSLIKNDSQNILRNMFVSEVFNKNAIFIVLLIILVQLTFLLSISSVLQRQNPLPPPQECAGDGEITGSFHPLAAALVMDMKQRGLGLKG